MQSHELAISDDNLQILSDLDVLWLPTVDAILRVLALKVKGESGRVESCSGKIRQGYGKGLLYLGH